MIKVIIFDYGHTLLVPESQTLRTGAEEVLSYFDEKDIKLALVSGTKQEEYRRQQLNSFGIYAYFEYMNFIAHEDTKNFKPVVELFKVHSDEVLVVGDRITSEITEGNRLELKTCRLLAGPEKNMIPQTKLEIPDFTIENLKELIFLVK